MIVVAFAMVGSLTVLPALLSRFGDGVERLQVPFVGRLRRDNGEGRVWGAIVDRVLRRPLLSAVLAGGLLLALAAPALQLRMATPGPDTFPKSLDVVKTYNRMQAAFPGTALPANIVVRAPDVNALDVRRAIGRLRLAALATGRVREPITIEKNSNHTIANITVPILGKGTDAQSNASLAALREHVLPQTVGAVPNVQSGVTGLTAEWKDAKDRLKSKLPLVVGFVLLLAFGLMLVAFRSIVVAIKAIILNLLSVAAAYGVLVLVFQHGIGKGLLGFSSTAGIDPVTPLLLFVILFGLSMDYHVFIISRIRETLRRRCEHGRRDLTRDQVHRRGGHERGDRHDRRLLDLRDSLDADLQAVRRRARGGDPDRRHTGPRRAPARNDEAAGRAELVPPGLARVAPALRGRGSVAAP